MTIEKGRKLRPRHNEQGERVYRLVSARIGFVGPSYHLVVPAAIARLIGPDAEFTIELTDDGILYRKVSGETRASTLPEWLR